MSVSNNFFLNDSWNIFFHDPYDFEWGADSYKNIGTMNTIEDYVNIFKAFNELFKKGMFFIMRIDIMPRYEDKYNINGGCFSFKILPDDLHDRLFKLTSNILGENIGITNNITNNINGISISPKKFYYIARIWIKDNKYAKKEYYNFDIPKYATLMYKNHV